ncbi:MAG: hypothetical protein V2I43_20340 [Parvularcula sp.]|jgi:hypothetical protein|nr:hypothetical protein [Parvularcula sp.]
MDKKPAYAILRIKKIHSPDDLDSVEGHNTRTIPAGTIEDAPAPVDWVNMTGSFRERAQQVFKETGATWEEGKVLSAEMVLTASPEWWANASVEQKKEWIKVQFKFAIDKFGPGLISFIPHLDESTPHVQLVGLPLYEATVKKRGRKPSKPESIARRAREEARAPKVWRLSYDKLFGGHGDRLADLQTEYHGHVEHLGLARGEDTRGKGRRHKPLKEYKRELQETKKRLVEGQKLLDAAWAELAEERAVQIHYDEELRARHERALELQQKNFNDDFDNRMKALDLHHREQSLERREEEAKKRKAELDEREGLLNTRDAELAEREARRIAQLQEQEEERQRINEDAAKVQADSAALEERTKVVERRERKVTDREEAAEERERKLQTIETQLSILGRLATGKLKGTWDTLLGRPYLGKEEEDLDEGERKALKSLMPPWLKQAMKLAVEFAEKREKFRSRARKALARLFDQKRAVKAKEAEAAREKKEAASAKQDAALVTTAANELSSKAKTRDAAASAKEKAASTRLAAAIKKEVDAARRLREAESAEEKSKDLTDELAQKRQEIAAAEQEAERVRAPVREAEENERAALDRATDAENRRTSAEAETASAKREKAEVRAEIDNEERELSKLRTKRTALQDEIRELKSDREELEAEVRAIENDRAEFESEREVHEVSRKLLLDISAAGRYARMNGGVLELFPEGKTDGKPERTLEVKGFAPWLPKMVDAYSSMVSSSVEFERQAKLLSDRYAAIAQQYPEKLPELELQAAQDKAAMAALAAQHLQSGVGE